MKKQDHWHLNAEQIIFQEGDAWDGLYLIKSGHVEIFRVSQKKRVRLGLMGPGEFLGTVTLFSREPRTASAQTLDDCVLQHFTADDLSRSFSQLPPSFAAIFKDIQARLRHVNHQFVETTLESGTHEAAWLVSLRHLRRLVYFLIALCPHACVPCGPGRALKLDGFYDAAAGATGLRADYVEKLLALLTKSHLLVPISLPGERPWLLNPSIPYLQAFLEFTAKPNSLEIVKPTVVEQEIAPALRLLTELISSHDFKDLIRCEKLFPLLEKLYPEVACESLVNQLAELGFLGPIKTDAWVVPLCPKVLEFTFNRILAGLPFLVPQLAL